jgi:membrane-anchored protein YejM (alkaline phosphatase superfamily)
MPRDNHVFQREMYQLLVPELDHVLFHLVMDLEQRRLLNETLVIAMGEFGRSLWLIEARGMEHYSKGSRGSTSRGITNTLLQRRRSHR